MTTIFFDKDRLKKKDILLHIIDVVNNNLGSELDKDTHAIMFGRPLDHHIREWDPLYGTRPPTIEFRDTFLQYVANLLLLMMMGVIGFWIRLGEERQRYRRTETSLLKIPFPAGEDVNWDDYPSEFIESQSSRRAGLAPRNRPMADGGWGAAISHLAHGVEWAPDPPQVGPKPTKRNY